MGMNWLQKGSTLSSAPRAWYLPTTSGRACPRARHRGNLNTGTPSFSATRPVGRAGEKLSSLCYAHTVSCACPERGSRPVLGALSLLVPSAQQGSTGMWVWLLTKGEWWAGTSLPGCCLLLSTKASMCLPCSSPIGPPKLLCSQSSPEAQPRPTLSFSSPSPSLSSSSPFPPPPLLLRSLLGHWGPWESNFSPVSYSLTRGRGRGVGTGLVLPVRTLSSGHHPSLLPHPSHRNSYPGQQLNLRSQSADLAPACTLCSSRLWPRGSDPACRAPPASLQA